MLFGDSIAYPLRNVSIDHDVLSAMPLGIPTVIWPIDEPLLRVLACRAVSANIIERMR